MEKKLILYVLFFPLLLNHAYCQAADTIQVNKRQFRVGMNTFAGFIVKHSEGMGHLVQSHPVGLEVYFNKRTFGRKEWHPYYNYPESGISVSYFDLKNKILEKAITGIYYLDFYPVRNLRSEVLYKIGMGLAYSTNPYDKEDNNKNNVVSNRLSFAVQVRVGYHYKVNSNWKITSALSLTHFSNGAFKLPNLGINIASCNVGVAYTPFPETVFLKREKGPFKKEGVKFNAAFATGLKEIRSDIGVKYPFACMSIYLDKKIKRFSTLNMGFDMFYSLALKEQIKLDNTLPEGLSPDFKRVAITGGHELLIGKVSILAQLGIYIYRPYKSDFPVYQRYGLKYYIKEKYFCSLMLKTHYAVADAAEWGIGVRF